MNNVEKVIKVAEAEEGYLEKSRSAYLKDHSVLDRKTDGAGSDNYTKYGRDMHNLYPQVMDFPAYWCDAFVDWCFQKAYGVSNAKKLLGGNFDDYTVASAQLYKNKNAYHKSNPKIGDQIFFNNGVRICHTGIVYKVDSKYVYTIEGNTSGGSSVISNGGGVVKKKYSLTYNRIDGYGRPKYDVKETKKDTSTSAPTKSYFTAYKGDSTNLDEIFKSIGATAYYDNKYSNYMKRNPIAKAQGISNYSGKSEQNTKLKNLAKNGLLVKP